MSWYRTRVHRLPSLCPETLMQAQNCQVSERVQRVGRFERSPLDLSPFFASGSVLLRVSCVLYTRYFVNLPACRNLCQHVTKLQGSVRFFSCALKSFLPFVLDRILFPRPPSNALQRLHQLLPDTRVCPRLDELGRLVPATFAEFRQMGRTLTELPSRCATFSSRVSFSAL